MFVKDIRDRAATSTVSAKLFYIKSAGTERKVSCRIKQIFFSKLLINENFDLAVSAY
jgi:hypothetical protein